MVSSSDSVMKEMCASEITIEFHFCGSDASRDTHFEQLIDDDCISSGRFFFIDVN